MMLGKKGMAATIDAMFFILILGIVVSAVFAYMPEGSEGPLAEKVHNDIFATELRMSDVFDVSDPKVVPMDYIVAAHISSGEGSVEEYLRALLRSMIPMSNGFELRCEFRGSVMTISDGDGPMSSYFSSERKVYGETLRTSLTIF